MRMASFLSITPLKTNMLISKKTIFESRYLLQTIICSILRHFFLTFVDSVLDCTRSRAVCCQRFVLTPLGFWCFSIRVVDLSFSGYMWLPSFQHTNCFNIFPWCLKLYEMILHGYAVYMDDETKQFFSRNNRTTSRCW